MECSCTWTFTSTESTSTGKCVQSTFPVLRTRIHSNMRMIQNVLLLCEVRWQPTFGYLFEHRENSSLLILSCFRKMWRESLWNHKEYEFNNIILKCPYAAFSMHLRLYLYLHLSPHTDVEIACTSRCLPVRSKTGIFKVLKTKLMFHIFSHKNSDV